MVTSYDVMISHMTQMTSHWFHAGDSLERMIGFMSLHRAKRTGAVDS